MTDLSTAQWLQIRHLYPTLAFLAWESKHSTDPSDSWQRGHSAAVLVASVPCELRSEETMASLYFIQSMLRDQRYYFPAHPSSFILLYYYYHSCDTFMSNEWYICLLLGVMSPYRVGVAAEFPSSLRGTWSAVNHTAGCRERWDRRRLSVGERSQTAREEAPLCWAGL